MVTQPSPESMSADEEDYADLFQRLATLHYQMKREGRSPALLAGEANLDLAIGNAEEALNAAREFLAMAETEEQKTEARYLLAKCQTLLRRHEKAKKKEVDFDG